MTYCLLKQYIPHYIPHPRKCNICLTIRETVTRFVKLANSKEDCQLWRSVHTNVRYAHSRMGNITTLFILISHGQYHHPLHPNLTWALSSFSSYSHLGKGAWSLQIRPGHLFCSLWVTVQHLWTSKKMFTKTEINVITWMGFQPSSSAMFSMRYTT